MAATLCLKFNVAHPSQLRASQSKMAMLPELARLRTAPSDDEKTAWPILQCENVFVLPGVPAFFEEKLATICEHFLTQRKIFMSKVALALEESTMAEHLNSVVAKFPGVAFGSYPYFNHPDAEFLTIVTVESTDTEVTKSALQEVVDGMPQEAVL